MAIHGPEVGSRHAVAGAGNGNGQDPFWNLRHASLLSVGRLVRLHLSQGWRLLLLVGFGILVAVALISSVPLYSNLVSNVQLQSTINGEPVIARNVEMQIPGLAADAQLLAQEDQLVRSLGTTYLGDITQPDVTRYLTADQIPLIQLHGAAIDPRNIRVTFEAFDYRQALPHMRLIAGTVPQPSASGSGELPGAVITQQMATDQHLQVGDTFVAGESPVFGSHLPVRVVGIWTPRQVDDPFWNGRTFTAVSSIDGPIVYPVLLDQGTFIQGLLAFPQIETRQHWVYYTIPTRITTANMGAVADHVGKLRIQLAATVATVGAGDTLVLTALDQNIHDEVQQVGLLGLPLYIVAAQVLALALLFVAAMAGLLVERESAEIATLKSRGTSGAQFLGSYVVVGALLGALAVLAGPWLASGLAVGLARWLIPASTLAAAAVGTADLTRLAPPAAAETPAVLGGLLGVGAVVVAAQRAARLDVLAFRREQGRPARPAFWRRYYVDLQVAALCALAYIDLSLFGGLGTREQLGSGASSPVLLMAPALLLLGGTLLLLRVFPLAVAAGVRLAARARGSVGMLALAQVARSPAGPSRLALLLALAVGLGLFALTFDASLSQNTTDLASYQVGADVRLTETDAIPPVVDQRLQTQLSALPGVQGLTSAFRDQLFTTFAQGNNRYDVLAIDPSTWGQFAGATSWRSDYADTSLASLMAQMRAHQWVNSAAARAGQTPAGDPSHPLWALVSQTFAEGLHVRLGERFALPISHDTSTPSTFVVGAIVQDFPTLYPAASADGFIVLDSADYFGAYTAAFGLSVAPIGPNEYWLKTVDDPARRAALARALDQNAPSLQIARLDDRRTLQTNIAANPIEAGMRGLLLVGALTAGILAIFGSLAQSALAARQRTIQFAVLRTLGLTGSQLTRMLLGEQLVVYAFGLLGGTLLGIVLATATLPYLQFASTTLDVSQIGVPPYRLAADPRALLAFYAALAAAFGVALLVAARYATRLGLGKTMRLGED